MRERAVRMVHEAIAEKGERVGVVTRVARHVGWTLRAEANWPVGVRRVEVPDAVVARPTFAGTDGRAYVLQLT